MKIARDTIYFFCILYILFVPVELFLFSFQDKLTAFIFTDLITIVSRLVFGKTIVQSKISSDSLALYTLVFILFFAALTAALFINSISRCRQQKETIHFLFERVLCFYLSLQLFIYGADKIFKAQFYLPEPNTLYTPLGFISRDLLYWSTIGSSYSYSVFLGLTEVLAATLLIFRKTRLVGLLVAAVLMLNIVMVNFSFDISVKLHSSFLLLLTALLLWTYGKTLFRFFILHEPARIVENKFSPFQSQGLNTGLKTFAIGIILFETFYPFVNSKNYNDDLAARPAFHGAYEVQKDSVNGPPIKRFFIHRDGYLVFQNNRDEMRDFKLFIDTNKQYFLLFDYNRKSIKIPYKYSSNDSLLTLQYFYDNKNWFLRGKALNWRNLPALKDQFHWTVEEVR